LEKWQPVPHHAGERSFFLGFFVSFFAKKKEKNKTENPVNFYAKALVNHFTIASK
jgi:hypothetical protein